MPSRKLTSVSKLTQALRRSIKGEKDSKPHINIAPKSAVAIVPPKKVRRDSPSLVRTAHACD
jgi:bud emergence protein 1